MSLDMNLNSYRITYQDYYLLHFGFCLSYPQPFPLRPQTIIGNLKTSFDFSGLFLYGATQIE